MVETTQTTPVPVTQGEADVPERVELKPCPFCGGEWVHINRPAHPRVPMAVKCRACNASGPLEASKQSDEQIRAAWNTRTPSEAVAEARQTITDTLMDSQYLAGAKAGWNAANSDDPETAYAQLQASRSGYMAEYAAARAALKEQS